MDRLRDRLAISPERYVAVAWTALAALTLIVFTGSAVRVTGSGLGCSDWPRCEPTSLTPEELHAPVIIEFGNRMLTGFVGFATLAALVFAWSRRPFRRDLTRLGAILVAGTAAQAIIGGISVRVDLSYSVVMLHYMASIAVLFAAVLLVWRAAEPGDRPRAPAAPDARTALQVRVLCASALLSLFAGTAAAAAGPHSGGEGTDDLVERLSFAGEETLQLVVWIHGAGAAILGLSVLAAWWVARRRGAGPGLMRPLTLAALLLGTQGVLGIVQYQLELPDLLVWIHVCLATLTWNVLVWAALAAGRSADVALARHERQGEGRSPGGEGRAPAPRETAQTPSP